MSRTLPAGPTLIGTLTVELSGIGTARLPVENVWIVPGGGFTVRAGAAALFALLVSSSVVVTLAWAVRWPARPVANTLRVLLAPAPSLPSEQLAMPLMTSHPAALLTVRSLPGSTLR